VLFGQHPLSELPPMSLNSTQFKEESPFSATNDAIQSQGRSRDEIEGWRDVSSELIVIHQERLQLAQISKRIRDCSCQLIAAKVPVDEQNKGLFLRSRITHDAQFR